MEKRSIPHISAQGLVGTFSRQRYSDARFGVLGYGPDVQVARVSQRLVPKPRSLDKAFAEALGRQTHLVVLEAAGFRDAAGERALVVGRLGKADREARDP